jgi:hypothetical protein
MKGYENLEFEDEDSQGKNKVPNSRSRAAVLTTALIVGLCLGMLFSEKLYLMTQESDTPSSALQALQARKIALQAKVTHITPTTYKHSGPPRSELEKKLREVAPDGEVMIAISNINLIHDNSLTLWLEVGEA